MLELIAHAGEPGRAILEACGQDGLAGSLLLLYGLHPLGTETRVRQALTGLRPHLLIHGYDVGLHTHSGSAVRLRVRRTAVGGEPLVDAPHDRSPLAPTIRAALEEAVRDAAPEVDVIEIDEEGQMPRPFPFSLPLVGS
jgi:hypothetical protein